MIHPHILYTYISSMLYYKNVEIYTSQIHILTIDIYLKKTTHINKTHNFVYC